MIKAPKDYETHMSRDAQVTYAQTAIAWIVLISSAVAFLVYLVNA